MADVLPGATSSVQCHRVLPELRDQVPVPQSQKVDRSLVPTVPSVVALGAWRCSNWLCPGIWASHLLTLGHSVLLRNKKGLASVRHKGHTLLQGPVAEITVTRALVAFSPEFSSPGLGFVTRKRCHGPLGHPPQAPPGLACPSLPKGRPSEP